MRIKISKVARGIAPGDVANSAIRNILTDLSITMRGKFTEDDMIETMEYFDYRCPYTGKDLRDMLLRGDYSEMATDHIVPQNKQHCGLNVPGNLVIVDKKANQAKKDKTVEDFLLHDQTVLAGVPQAEREARLEKIKNFQKDKQYDPDAIRAVVSPILAKFYGDVGAMLQQKANQIATGLGLSKSFAIRKQQKTGNTELVFLPNQKAVQDYILSHQCALIDLEYMDSNHNRHFKWEAKNFTSKSKLRGNVTSRPWWRTKDEDGLIKVTVSIPQD